MTTDARPRYHPAIWIPTLFFAEGLPFFIVAGVASTMYKNLGVANDAITWYTGLLVIMWVVKPLWSPFLESFRDKRSVVVLFQLVGGLSLALVAFALPLPGYFHYTIAILAVTAFCSATHDIAADGLYIASLPAKEQSAYSGWLGAAYNLAKAFAKGGLITVAGFLATHTTLTRAWMTIFGLAAGIMVALGLYHSRVLPSSPSSGHGSSASSVAATLWDVIRTFFQKRNILLMLAFIVLFRAGEGQVVAVGGLFLLDERSAGGLGLGNQEIGYLGIATAFAFVLGSIAGGYFASWLGLRRALFWLICVMNLPNLAYLYLSAALPTDKILIGLALAVENFGYGFGFVGLTLYMMQEVAPGPYQTAHYSLSTGVMALGLMIPTMFSGRIQQWLGYPRFFVWVVISAIPALVLSRLLPFHEPGPAGAASAAEPSPA